MKNFKLVLPIFLILFAIPAYLFAGSTNNVNMVFVAPSGSDVCTIDQTDLVFHDDMDDVTDTHLAVTGQTVSVTGTGAAPTTDTGLCNDSTYFDAITDDGFTLTMASAGVSATEGSIVFWYKPKSLTPGVGAYIFHDSSFQAFIIQQITSGDIICRWNSSTQLDASASLSITAFTKIQFSWNVTDLGGGNYQTETWLYADDILIDSDDVTNTNSPSLGTDMWIGQKDASDNEGAQGYIDNFLIYDTVIIP